MDLAEAALADIVADGRDTGAYRRDARCAVAIREVANPRFRRLLIPLLYDPAPEVADEAMESVRVAGADDFIFVPTLIALLRHRQPEGPREGCARRLR